MHCHFNGAREIGFSLIEMIVTVALLGILASIAAPSYDSFIKSTKVKNAATSINTGLQLARSEAVKRNIGVQLDLVDSNSSWIVCVAPGELGDSCPSSGDDVIQIKGANEGSDGILIANDDGPYVFDSLGTLINGNSGINVSESTGKARELFVKIGAGGSSKVCVPSLDSSDPRSCV